MMVYGWVIGRRASGGDSVGEMGVGREKIIEQSLKIEDMSLL